MSNYIINQTNVRRSRGEPNAPIERWAFKINEDMTGILEAHAGKAAPRLNIVFQAGSEGEGSVELARAGVKLNNGRVGGSFCVLWVGWRVDVVEKGKGW